MDSNFFTLVGFCYSDYFYDTGWHYVDGNVCYISSYHATYGINTIDVSNKQNPVIMQSYSHPIYPNGYEFVVKIGDYLVLCSFGNSAVVTVNASNPYALSPASYVQKTNELKGCVGATVVNNIWGRNRVLFVCAYQYASVTAIDISDFNNITYITTFQDNTNLSGAITVVYRSGYLLVACRWSKCLTVLDVLTTDTITYSGVKLVDALAIGNLGGMNDPPDGDMLYLPSRDIKAVCYVNIANPLAPFITGYVTDALLYGAYVIDFTSKYVICTARYSKYLLALDKNNSAPAIVGYKHDDTYLNAPDDIMYKDGYFYVGNTTGKMLSIWKLTHGLKTCVVARPKGSYATAKSVSKTRIVA